MRIISEIDIPFMLVSGLPMDFGRVRIANLALTNTLGFTLQDLKHGRIGIMQPKLIREVHDKIIERFIDSGE